MAGGVSSLNVSAAGAVVLFEAYRQRRGKARAQTRDKSGETPSKSKKQKGLGS
jgi:23S rRNA (guanosine2251-2'-O)-methyltransferase